MNEAKILILDIETAPNLAYVWDIWNQNISLNQIHKDWFILSWAAKWLGSNEMFSDSLFNYPSTFKKDKEDDSKIIKSVFKLLDEADIVVAHNGDKFDIPRLYTRALIHGINPPSPIRTIDTVKIARKVFGFTSNKLDYIAGFLDIGHKLKHPGMEMWLACMSGDPAAWEKMVKYNEQDVRLLEKVYIKLRPWHKWHPNLGLYVDDSSNAPVCPKCGSNNIIKDGTRTMKTNMSKYQRYYCKNCGAYSRGRKNLANREHLLAN